MKRSSDGYSIKRTLADVLIITAAASVAVCGFSIFVSANDLLPGGVWGISALVSRFTPLPMSALIIAFNAPLLLWGWRRMNLRFAVYTLYVVLLQSLLLELLPQHLPQYTGDTMLACLFGGLLEGLGGGLIVRRGGSAGGTEIAAIVLRERLDASPAYLNLALDVVIITLAGVVFGLELAMYTLVEHVVFSVVFSQVLEGVNRGRCLMIVTERREEIVRRIMAELHRGVTVMQAKGGWTQREKAVLYCVVTRMEMAPLKEIIRQEDPDAFVCITGTHEIFGRFNSYARQ